MDLSNYFFAAFQWIESIWTSDGECAEEGLACIIRSGSEDYSHSEKLHLCRRTSGHYRWGRLTLSSAVWCGRLMQRGTTNRVRRLGPAPVLMHTVCEACEDGTWRVHAASPNFNRLQQRMMSLLALQRSNQSPACLKGPQRSYWALIVDTIIADAVLITPLGHACVHIRNTLDQFLLLGVQKNLLRALALMF